MRLQAVGKRYGLRQPWIVRDVSQHVAAGRLIKLEGRNGSGKSTLLRVMAGVSVPSAGKVTGRPPVGYVPERFPGGLAFSAREYLQHLGRIHGLAAAAVGPAVDEWLSRLGAAEYAGSPLRTLSKGMCQKVAIAQALLARPGLLVLDEAWTGLDQVARGALDAAVAERLAEGSMVLFVDHDPARLAGMVTERWQLHDGTVTVLAGPAAAAPAALAAGGSGSDGPWSDGTRSDRPAATGPAATGPGGAAASAGGAQEAVLIELSGVETGSVSQLAGMPGVLSVRPGGLLSGASSQAPDAGRTDGVQLTVARADSDAVLRQLLTWDRIHVVAVRPGQEAAP